MEPQRQLTATIAIPPIYPITDKRLARRTTHLSILRELVRGGARWVQIRDKSTPAKELLEDLHRCVDFARENNVVLIMNDRCDLARICGASGVHLGQDELPPEKARIIVGRHRILGLSTHSLGQVRAASNLPIQYIGFGPIYPTATKNSSQPAVGLKRLAGACRASSFPVVGIGGIGLDTVRAVLDTGASSVAVISSLMEARDIAEQMQRFLEKAKGR
jgi:thiamine-phosphate pyrophosphorylase